MLSWPAPSPAIVAKAAAGDFSGAVRDYYLTTTVSLNDGTEARPRLGVVVRTVRFAVEVAPVAVAIEADGIR